MKIQMLFVILYFVNVSSIHTDHIKISTEYFSYKNARYVCYLSCEQSFKNVEVTKEFKKIGVRTSVRQIDEFNDTKIDLNKFLNQWNVGVGVLLQGNCDNTAAVLEMASKQKLLDAVHYWLVLAPDNVTNSTFFIEHYFHKLNLSIDADIVTVTHDETGYKLSDVFNFGKIQGNSLEITPFGSWQQDTGLLVTLKGYKYYHRWDFHNLTLRAVTVILDAPKVFDPEVLSNRTLYPGIREFTKVTSQVINIIKERHNFRFNYTVVDRWIESPHEGPSKAVTDSLYRGEQDITSTGIRINRKWLDWSDVCTPPISKVETRFFYLMPDKGIGEYENRFLTPMSMGVWWSVLAACGLCGAVLAMAARLEVRPEPGCYAVFSVSAIICQQDFEDGIQEERPSQGRKITLLVIGLTSMLLYNYYTSSVVSWLLNAAPPSIDTLDQLRDSNLELVFEDVGYTRGWLQNAGFYYYSGFPNTKEDELRDKKVTKAKRTVQLMQTATNGAKLLRTGGYAYHAEPYTVSSVIGSTFSEQQLCELGQLQMMPHSNVYIGVQKQSPYKEFINWSLKRLSERGHVAATRGHFADEIPACSGRIPRALALGQAAPAFIVLLQLTVLSVVILLLEILWHRRRFPAIPRWGR